MIYSSSLAVCLLVAVLVHHAAEALPSQLNEHNSDLLTGVVAFTSAILGSDSASSRREKRSDREDLDFEIDDDMIITAATLDDSGCGARMLCELTQKGPDQLNGTLSKKLVQVFDGNKAPTYEELKTEPKAAFQYAAYIGTSSPKDLKICGRVFNTCPFNAELVLMAIREMPLEMFRPAKDGQDETKANL